MGELFFVVIFILACVSSKKRQTRQETLSLSLETTQFIRGVACVLIVFGHCVRASADSFLRQLNVGWYCVAMFMFISGWGVAVSCDQKENYLRTFWKGRIIKIGIPFLTANIIYGFIKRLYGIKLTGYDWLMSFLGQCSIVDNSWYCVAILFLYCVFWLIAGLHLPKIKKLILLWISVIVLTYVEYWVLGISSDWWFISNFSFPLGVTLQQKRRTAYSFIHGIAVAIVGYMGAYVAIPIFHRLLGTYSDLVYIAASNFRSMFLSLLTIELVDWWKPKNRVASALGTVSYEIYLLHGLFIFIFSRNMESVCGIFVLTMLCCVPVSWLLKKCHSSMIKNILRWNTKETRIIIR